MNEGKKNEIEIRIMKRKDIEKAAIDYSGRDDGVTLKMEIYAFMEGAEWRINSVWHKDLKIGEPKKPILVRFKNGLFMVFEDIRELKGIESEVEMFAYIEDLIPNSEECV